MELAKKVHECFLDKPDEVMEDESESKMEIDNLLGEEAGVSPKKKKVAQHLSLDEAKNIVEHTNNLPFKMAQDHLEKLKSDLEKYSELKAKAESLLESV